jgi:hypothetical protein
MPLTDDEIKALLEGCEGVTPGPWRPDPWDGNEGNVCANDVYVAQCVFGKDIAHIARCDPGTIAELAARLLEAEAEAAEYKASLNAMHQAHVATEARVKVLEEALTPFSLFFKSEKHDLSPAADHTIVASFLEQNTKLPLAELTIADFRKASAALQEKER